MNNNFDHEHEHSHEHEHTHTHEHNHDTTEEGNKDERTLQILLTHWVEHNKSHEESFLEWIGKAKTMGKEHTSEYIEKAVEYMEMADNMLIEAKKHM